MSKCKGGFPWHGSLAVWAEISQGDVDPPWKVNFYVWAGYPHPQVQGV